MTVNISPRSLKRCPRSHRIYRISWTINVFPQLLKYHHLSISTRPTTVRRPPPPSPNHSHIINSFNHQHVTCLPTLTLTLSTVSTISMFPVSPHSLRHYQQFQPSACYLSPHTHSDIITSFNHQHVPCLPTLTQTLSPVSTISMFPVSPHSLRHYQQPQRSHKSS